MKKRVSKLSKKVLVITLIISAVLLTSLFIYAAMLNTWDGGYEFTRFAGQSLTVHYGNAGGTSSPGASCWKLYRTSTDTYNVFVPTKTSGEMSAFVAHKPSSITVSSGAVPGDWSTCNWNSIPCSPPPNCPLSSCTTPQNYCGSGEFAFCGNIMGTKTCTRTCTNPSPSCGGATCSGSAVTTQSCVYTNCGAC